MKLGYLINQYPKVSHSFIRREIVALERQGVEVHRFALRGWEGELADRADADERRKTRYLLEQGPLPLLRDVLECSANTPAGVFRALRSALRQWQAGDRSLLRNLAALAEACTLKQWCAQQHIGHLHAHFGTNSAQVAMLCSLLGGPGYSMTVHGPDEFDAPRALALSDKIAHARFVVAISEYTRAQLQRWCRIEDADRIHVVHCGLDASFLGEDPVPVGDQARFLCVGRLCNAKAQTLLVQAFSQVREKRPDAQLILAGDGELRPEVEALVRKQHLGDSVRITGWVDESRIREELRNCRALVLPSRQEGLPLVLMEALALHRPVITTYIAGIPELVAPASAGWLVPAGDVQALSAAMQDCLATDADKLRAMAARGHDAVATRHDIDTEAARLRALFMKYAGLHASPLAGSERVLDAADAGAVKC